MCPLICTSSHQQSRAVPAAPGSANGDRVSRRGTTPTRPGGTSSGSQLLLSKSPHFTGPSLCAGRNLYEKLLNCFKDICNCSLRSCVRCGRHRLLRAAGDRAAELHGWRGRTVKGLTL